MQRLLLSQLKTWKQQRQRKPLLIDGARQTGKTWLLRELFGKTFDNALHIDFMASPEMAQAFEGSLKPVDIIDNLELLTGTSFNPKTDLLILDEIGECQRAVTSLKYFAEQAADMFVSASGSNIGLINSFPVGKVEQHPLRPMSFHEFLLAGEEVSLIKAYENQLNSAAAHNKLFNKLTDYYFTGGMPEAVKVWYAFSELSIIERIDAVQRIHANLLSGYQRDFGKYSGKTDAGLIEAVFNNIPTQLASVVDESVKRYKFKGVHPRKSRYQELESAINWLEKTGLLLKNYPVEGLPRTPLKAYTKANRVKLFMMDVGLLNHMLGIGYKEIKQLSFEYKGYIAENFVQQALAVLGLSPSYSWNDARAEIEFIAATPKGDIIPIEVKSGKRTRAKSLQSYITKCNPAKTIKLTGTQGSGPLEQKHLVYPLYYTEHAVREHVLETVIGRYEHQ